MPNIFLSYRRDDTVYIAGWIYDRLVARLERESVFKDVDSIPLGADFRRQLHQAVQQCDVLLAIIGREWLTIRDEHGEQRLADERDFVRIEIEAALQRDIPVIPLLVDGAAMPRPEHLPPSLCDLCYRQALTVRPDPDFSRDMDRLIAVLKKLPERQPTDQPQSPVPATRAKNNLAGDEPVKWPSRITNSLGSVLVRIPDETLSGVLHSGRSIYASTTCVSNRDYLAFVRDANWPAPRAPKGQKEAEVWEGNQCASAMLDHPVVFVTARDAVEFCRWLTEKEQRKPLRKPPTALPETAAYTLPRVGQWWAVLRSLRRVSLKDICIDRGWIDIHARHQPTEPVAVGPSNSLGIYHLLGNVFEWCRVDEPGGDPGTEFRALGGGWASDCAWLTAHVKRRTALRCPPNWSMKDGGFRIWLTFECRLTNAKPASLGVHARFLLP